MPLRNAKDERNNEAVQVFERKRFKIGARLSFKSQPIIRNFL